MVEKFPKNCHVPLASVSPKFKPGRSYVGVFPALDININTPYSFIFCTISYVKVTAAPKASAVDILAGYVASNSSLFNSCKFVHCIIKSSVSKSPLSP